MITAFVYQLRGIRTNGTSVYAAYSTGGTSYLLEIDPSDGSTTKQNDITGGTVNFGNKARIAISNNSYFVMNFDNTPTSILYEYPLPQTDGVSITSINETFYSFFDEDNIVGLHYHGGSLYAMEKSSGPYRLVQINTSTFSISFPFNFTTSVSMDSLSLVDDYKDKTTITDAGMYVAIILKTGAQPALVAVNLTTMLVEVDVNLSGGAENVTWLESYQGTIYGIREDNGYFLVSLATNGSITQVAVLSAPSVNPSLGAGTRRTIYNGDYIGTIKGDTFSDTWFVQPLITSPPVAGGTTVFTADVVEFNFTPEKYAAALSEVNAELTIAITHDWQDSISTWWQNDGPGLPTTVKEKFIAAQDPALNLSDADQMAALQSMLYQIGVDSLYYAGTAAITGGLSVSSQFKAAFEAVIGTYDSPIGGIPAPNELLMDEIKISADMQLDANGTPLDAASKVPTTNTQTPILGCLLNAHAFGAVVERLIAGGNFVIGPLDGTVGTSAHFFQGENGDFTGEYISDGSKLILPVKITVADDGETNGEGADGENPANTIGGVTFQLNLSFSKEVLGNPSDTTL